MRNEHERKTIVMSFIMALRTAGRLCKLLLVCVGALCVLTSAMLAGAATPSGYQSKGNPGNNTDLLGRFGELIARERAYQDTANELYNQSRGNSVFDVDGSMLSAVLGEEFFTLYDEVLPRLEALGQNSRRDQLALRFDAASQDQLIAGKRVAGINEGAVNNVIAHYKIAIEQMDFDIRQLLLAESLLMRRAADELSQGITEAGAVGNYVHFARASQLVAAPRQVKGYVQPRCALESEAIKRSRSLRNDIDDNFFFNEARQFQTSVQKIYDAAGLIEELALSLKDDGSHC